MWPSGLILREAPGLEVAGDKHKFPGVFPPQRHHGHNPCRGSEDYRAFVLHTRAFADRPDGEEPRERYTPSPARLSAPACKRRALRGVDCVVLRRSLSACPCGGLRLPSELLLHQLEGLGGGHGNLWLAPAAGAGLTAVIVVLNSLAVVGAWNVPGASPADPSRSRSCILAPDGSPTACSLLRQTAAAICGLMLWMRRFWFLFRRYRIFSLTLQIICYKSGCALRLSKAGFWCVIGLGGMPRGGGQIICRLAQAAIIPRHQK